MDDKPNNAVNRSTFSIRLFQFLGFVVLFILLFPSRIFAGSRQKAVCEPRPIEPSAFLSATQQMMCQLEEAPPKKSSSIESIARTAGHWGDTGKYSKEASPNFDEVQDVLDDRESSLASRQSDIRQVARSSSMSDLVAALDIKYGWLDQNRNFHPSRTNSEVKQYIQRFRKVITELPFNKGLLKILLALKPRLYIITNLRNFGVRGTVSEKGGAYFYYEAGVGQAVDMSVMRSTVANEFTHLIDRLGGLGVDGDTARPFLNEKGAAVDPILSRNYRQAIKQDLLNLDYLRHLLCKDAGIKKGFRTAYCHFNALSRKDRNKLRSLFKVAENFHEDNHEDCADLVVDLNVDLPKEKVSLLKSLNYFDKHGLQSKVLCNPSTREKAFYLIDHIRYNLKAFVESGDYAGISDESFAIELWSALTSYPSDVKELLFYNTCRYLELYHEHPYCGSASLA